MSKILPGRIHISKVRPEKDSKDKRDNTIQNGVLRLKKRNKK